MRALSIRQPYVEEILRLIKKVEYRSWAVSDELMGVEFYIYAAMRVPDEDDTVERFAKLGAKPGELPVGVILGTAKISHCTGSGTEYEWHLTDVKRLEKPIKPKKHPQPSWFNPF